MRAVAAAVAKIQLRPAVQAAEVQDELATLV
jgi:hypothetical protein